MSSSVFLREINRLFIISVFIPSHEDTILIEWESLEASLFIDLYGSLPLIEWTSDSISFFCDWDGASVEEDEIFLSCTQEIFIFIDLEE